MSRPPAVVKVVEGASKWDLLIPAPTITEIEVCTELWAYNLIEGETYFGSRWPVMLIRWRKETS